jgi:hypothetical protein
MNTSTFRKTLCHQLDRAVKGERVTIERGGVNFLLLADVQPTTHARRSKREERIEEIFDTMLQLPIKVAE